MKNSVCMASYNGEKFIRRQIDSILFQLGLHDELIISDDGSTDSTCEIVESYRDPRIVLLHHKMPCGISANFENAIVHARGDIIFLSDQDDVWLPNKVERVVRAFAESSAKVVHHSAVVVDSDDKVIHPSYTEYRGIRRGLLKNWIKASYLGCCMAFKREILKDLLPFYKSRSMYFMHDDWVGLVGEINGGVCFIPDILMKYYRHGGNSSQLHGGDLKWKVLRRTLMARWILSCLMRRFVRKMLSR